MKKMAVVFAVLFFFSVSAYAQTGAGMMPEKKGQMGPGMMGGEGKMPMMPMCQEMMKQQMGEGQQMPMCPMCMKMMKEHKSMMQMMMNMMQMQKKMMKGVKPAEKKEMMMEMDKMHEKMDQMMSKRMGMMGGMPKMKCAEEWLKKAIDLHEVHIKDPKTATDASQMEMMDQMKKAYECITGAVKGAPSEEPKTGETKKEVTPKADPHKH